MTLFGAATGGYTRELDDGRRLDVRWGAATDTGRVRERNEDSIVASAAVCAIADGMGGHEAGDRASAAIAGALAEVPELPAPRHIYDALQRASLDIERISTASGGRSGSTVTGVAFGVFDGEPGWLVFNIGDSRVYSLHGDQLTQITHDHSVVQGLIDTGQISEADAERHPARNSITRAVGFSMDPRPDFWHLNLVPRLRLLVCSDGLTKELAVDQVAALLAEHAEPEKAARALVDAALEHGGRDNVSVIVVDSVATAPTDAPAVSTAEEPSAPHAPDEVATEAGAGATGEPGGGIGGATAVPGPASAEAADEA
jgi:serine/threonine protein phosphatase PrpC